MQEIPSAYAEQEYPTMKRAMLVGLDPDAVDFDRWPELSPIKLRTAFDEISQTLKDHGIDPVMCLLDGGPASQDVFVQALKQHNPDVICIGAGVRKDERYLHLLEQLINAASTAAPSAKIAFNTLPYDTVEAVERWL